MDDIDIPNGYKQTKAGIIPEVWDVKKIKEFAKTTAGGTPSTTHPEYWGGSIPWMNSGDLNKKIVEEVSGRITELGLKKSSAKIIPKNSILIGLAGQGKTRGTAAMNLIDLSINQSIAAIIPDCNVILPEYLYQNLDSRYQELRDLSTGAKGRGGLNLSIINGIFVLIPPYSEQTAIASILTTVDEAIATTEAIIARTEELKRGFMQVILTRGIDKDGQVRSEETHAFKDSPIGRVPVEWDVKKIKDFARTTSGGTPSTKHPEYWGGSIPWMCSGDLNKKIVDEVSGRITEIGLKESSAKIVPKESILIGLAGQGKTRGTAAMNLIDLSINQSIAAIISDTNTISPKYLYHNLDSRYAELRNLSTGAKGRGGLNISIIKGIFVPLPPLPEQKKVASILTTIDFNLSFVEKQYLNHLNNLKTALMQDLLTGRVPVPEEMRQETLPSGIEGEAV
ncbi:restriction endonuclease subunit S [Methanogenium sp. MK-MG]|uniref:restriction endonuclease subunit S n=1 Tax=Methanogenium sp. MK-MG TaxID=2599926 RepID=UPI0013EC61CF|nr:restriction endonuclease subunit S [Methanogenium sp. MK-MG]KAF1078224.1 Type-1 restriction enzyme MjaXIP specificity protein [Methanogenium sp. MK-MG]